MATGNPERDIGAIEARLQRFQSLRQRVYDILPLAVLLVLLMGQWNWLWERFERIDQRFEQLDEQIDRIEQGQVDIKRLLQGGT